MTTTTIHTPKVYEHWFHAHRVEEPVLNYYEVAENYSATGAFATLDEALTYAKSQIRAHVYDDHVSHSRSFIRQRQVTTWIDLNAYREKEIYNAENGLQFSPCCGEIVGKMEVFLSSEELDALVESEVR